MFCPNKWPSFEPCPCGRILFQGLIATRFQDRDIKSGPSARYRLQTADSEDLIFKKQQCQLSALVIKTQSKADPWQGLPVLLLARSTCSGAGEGDEDVVVAYVGAAQHHSTYASVMQPSHSCQSLHFVRHFRFCQQSETCLQQLITNRTANTVNSLKYVCKS